MSRRPPDPGPIHGIILNLNISDAFILALAKVRWPRKAPRLEQQGWR